MKNQYFADINDYRKYGILRSITGNGEMMSAICWMLTDDDKTTDGKFVDYISNPKRFRDYDPTLFDSLALCLENKANRSVYWAEENNIIPKSVYFPELLLDKKGKRWEYFSKFKSVAAKSDILFFDPDNGIEVKSVPIGRKNCNKYIYWLEIIDAYASGKSLLIYQHFIREKRGAFIQKLVNRFSENLPITEMYSLRTANVVFFLIPQHYHNDYLAEKCSEISRKWYSQIQVSKH
jgi:hypothetical protein